MPTARGQDGPSPAETNQAHYYTPAVSQETALDSKQASRDQKATLKDVSPLSRSIVFFMTLHFLLAYCELILVAPLIKLFEQSLCISYYDSHGPSDIGSDVDLPELMCKIQEVQAPLATIRGWKSLFDTIPG